MPDAAGSNSQRSKQVQPTLSVLMLSMHPEEQYAVRVLQAGASDTSPRFGSARIGEAVKKVVSEANISARPSRKTL